MLSAEVLQKIRTLQIRTSHWVTEVFAGEYQSRFKGRGIEFEDTRVYVPGDDIRNIDWNTTARTGVPHIKNFREERELTIILMVDISRSGIFGSGKRSKTEVAAEVAAILAHTALRKSDKVGLILFTDQIEHFIPAKKGRSHIWRVIRAILTDTPEHPGTGIAQALRFLNQVVRKKAVVFLISDFLDHNFRHALQVSQKRHDLIAVTIGDPREEDIPPMGTLELEDAETGAQRFIRVKSKEERLALLTIARRAKEERDGLFRALGMDQISISTHGSTIDPIFSFFQRRMLKIRR